MAYSQYLLALFLVLNSIDDSTAQLYTSYPRPGSQPPVALKQSVQLRCHYNSEGDDGQFIEWFKQNETHNVSVNTDKPGHYIVKTTKSESNLTIKIFVTADANVKRWYVKTKLQPTPACEFGPILLIPSPQGIKDNKGEKLESPHGSFRRIEDDVLTLKCLIEPNNPSVNSRINWQFNKNDNNNYGDLPDGIENNGEELTFEKVSKSHRGYYRCTLDQVAFTVLLRVKDKLAPLWPFLGIVSIVVILVVIILIFERRQKLNKKNTTTDDDDQDRASDPLVRTISKTSDNDNKKRVVKA